MNNDLKNILGKLGYTNSTYDGINDFAHNYYKMFKEREQGLPYWINLVEIMNFGNRDSGKNENGHSRFLCELFRYVYNGTHPALNSFINRFTDKKEFNCKITDESKITVKHTFSDSGRHPDIYVNQLAVYGSNGTISVVFENKIDDAEDRDNQMEDYIKGMFKDRENTKTNIPDSNCYAFYLISDYTSIKNDDKHDVKGRQKVDDKDVLNHLIPDENYILLSYKEDILPWLKDDMLFSPNEKYIIDNIKLYIDYLENRFSLRENINNLKIEVMNNINDINKLNIEELLALQDGLIVIINNRKNEIITSFVEAFRNTGFDEDTNKRKSNYDKGFKLQLIQNLSIWCEINISDSKRDFHIGIAVDDKMYENEKIVYYQEYQKILKTREPNEKMNENTNDFVTEIQNLGLVDDTLNTGSGYVKAWTFEDGDLDSLKSNIESNLSRILDIFKVKYPTLISKNG